MVNVEKPETWQATCAHEHTHIHTHTQPTVSSCVCLYIYVWCKPAGLCCNRGRMDIPAKKLQQPCRLWCIKHAHTGKDRVVCLFCSSSLYSWWWYFFSFFLQTLLQFFHFIHLWSLFQPFISWIILIPPLLHRSLEKHCKTFILLWFGTWQLSKSKNMPDKHLLVTHLKRSKDRKSFPTLTFWLIIKNKEVFAVCSYKEASEQEVA